MFSTKWLSASLSGVGMVLGLAGSALVYADDVTNWPLLVPGTLYLDGHVRARMESLDDQYRATGQGTDQVLALRTDLQFSMPLSRFRGGSEVVFELMDSRQFMTDDDTTLNTSTVNTLEAVQARLSLHSDLLPWQIGDHRLDFGRQTLDLGSRRLIARNRYRNTLNTFDGIHVASDLRYSKARIEGLVLYPVVRYPVEQEDIHNNQHEADKSSLQVQLLGLSAEGYVLTGRIRGAVQWLKVREADTSRVATRNRNISTYAGRLYLSPKPGYWDFDIEMMRQVGSSRLSTEPTDRTDLEHGAWFHHLELGYQFRNRWQWRVLVQYDYASGDADPDDDSNNRFDTLYGARRFDFGPTGIYGSFARSNISSPAVRMSFKPSRSTQIMMASRWYWLASDRDAWVGSGYHDTTGQSGRSLGVQPEFRLRWDAKKSVQVEMGAAWLNLGSYAAKAQQRSGSVRVEPVPDSTLYSYFQAMWQF